MKVITYNIRYGLGLDQRFDLERIADAVRDADIIGLQEVERNWRRSDMIDQPKRLGELLPDHYWAYYPAFDVDASSSNKSGPVINRRRQFGPMLLSRWPIESVRTILLPQLNTVDLLNMSTGAIECAIETPLGSLRVYSLHLSSISTRERMLQIDTLLNAHSRFISNGGVCTGSSQPDDPVEVENFIRMDWHNGDPLPVSPENTLFLGDFNSQEESPEYVRFAGETDPVYGRGIHPDEFVDSWSVAKETVGEPTTWWPDPPDRAPGFAVRLDYCFASAGLARHIARAWVDTDAVGSDHKPYWVIFDE